MFFKKIKYLFRAIFLLKNWYDFILVYYRLNNKKYVDLNTRNNSSLKIRTQSSDIHVFAEIWLDNVYLQKFNLNENSTVIDIGAHIGLFSLFISKKLKNAKIYSYEPNLENHNLMIENIKKNCAQNISAFNVAVSSQLGSTLLYLDEKDSAAHSVFKKTALSVNVNSVTLEKIIKDNKISSCELLKLDCEGAEYEILMKTPKEILTKINKISLEYEKIPEITYSIEDIISKLRSCGFRVTINETESDRGFLYAQKM